MEIEQEIIDLVELVDFTLSQKFVDTWKFKFSEKFIKNFQFKLLECFQQRKPVKLRILHSYLKKNNKYSSEQVSNFFRSVQIDLYRPIIK